MKAGSSDGGTKLMVWHGLSVLLAVWTACHALFLLPEPDFTHVPPDVSRACQIRMNMRILYLSAWNYVAYGFFVFLSLIQYFTTDRRLRKILDWSFTTYVLPFSLLVSTVFWTAQSVSPSLLVPAPLSPLLTPCLNHTVHSSVAFGVVFELLSRPVRFPRQHRRKTATVRRHQFLLAWQFINYTLFATTGVFMYPVSGMTGWPIRILLDIFMHSVLLASDFVPRILAAWWWSPERLYFFDKFPIKSATDFLFDRGVNQTQFRCKLDQRTKEHVPVR